MNERLQLKTVMREHNFTKIKTEVKYLKMKKSEKYNGSGCLDMTAFMALKNIERERVKKSGHKRKLKKKKQRKL